MYFAPVTLLYTAVALKLHQNLQYPDGVAMPPLKSSNDHFRLIITAFLKLSDVETAERNFLNQINELTIDKLTQEELIESHLCLSYIQTIHPLAITNELRAKNKEITDRLRPIKQENVVDRITIFYDYLKKTPFHAVHHADRSHHQDVLDIFLNLFIVAHVIQSDFRLLPKFQVHELFVMLDKMGHMPVDLQKWHLTVRSAGKLAMIHRVYKIPQTNEFMTKISKCIRADEQLRTDFCYPVILDGRMNLIDSHEWLEPGDFRHEALRETQELIYNAIGHYEEEDIRNVCQNTRFVAELLITECILRDAESASTEIIHLQNEPSIIQNIKKMKKPLRDCSNLTTLNRIALSTCNTTAMLAKQQNGHIFEKEVDIRAAIVNILKNIQQIMLNDPQHIPEYLQHLIFTLCEAAGPSVISDDHRELAPFLEMIHSFKETEDFLQIIKSQLRNIGKFNEFVRNLIEDIYANLQPDNNHRRDLIALKKLYLTLTNMNRIVVFIDTKAIMSIGNQIDIEIIRNLIETNGIRMFNLDMRDFRTSELIALLHNSEGLTEFEKIKMDIKVSNKLKDLSMYILTLKNLEKQRTSMANWDSLQTIIGHQLQIKKHIPVSLQFGLVGLANYVPETLQQLRSQINEFETNTKIRANIRKWFEENGELNSSIERQIIKYFTIVTTPLESNSKHLDIARTLMLLLSNIDLLDINEQQLSFTNMILIKWMMNALNSPNFIGAEMKTMTQNDDFSKNLNVIDRRLVASLDQYPKIWPQENLKSNSQAMLTFINEDVKEHVRASYTFQQNAISILMKISMEEGQHGNSNHDLSHLPSADKGHFYLAPSIACGFHYLQKTRNNLALEHSMQARFTHACHFLEEFLRKYNQQKSSNNWTSLFNYALRELYTAENEDKLQIAAIRFYTYLGGLHDIHRNHLSAELKIRIRIALHSLREVFPKDRPTIEWLNFVEIEIAEMRRSTLANILRDYHEIDDFASVVADTEKSPQLCTAWLMVLLKGRFCKRHTLDLAAFDETLRKSRYPAKMAHIDSMLEPHCANSNVTDLLNETRCELSYNSLIETTGDSIDHFMDSDFCAYRIKAKLISASPSPRLLAAKTQRRAAFKRTRNVADGLLSAGLSMPMPQSQRSSINCEWPCDQSAWKLINPTPTESGTFIRARTSFAQEPPQPQVSSIDVPRDASSMGNQRKYAAPILNLNPKLSQKPVTVTSHTAIDPRFASFPKISFRNAAVAYETLTKTRDSQAATADNGAGSKSNGTTSIEGQMRASGIFSHGFLNEFAQQKSQEYLKSNYPQDFGKLLRFMEDNWSENDLGRLAPVSSPTESFTSMAAVPDVSSVSAGDEAIAPNSAPAKSELVTESETIAPPANNENYDELASAFYEDFLADRPIPPITDAVLETAERANIEIFRKYDNADDNPLGQITMDELAKRGQVALIIVKRFFPKPFTKLLDDGVSHDVIYEQYPDWLHKLYDLLEALDLDEDGLRSRASAGMDDSEDEEE